jgi:hypothetical protein
MAFVGFFGAIISAPLLVVALAIQMVGTGDDIYGEIGLIFLALITSGVLVFVGIKRSREVSSHISDSDGNV